MKRSFTMGKSFKTWIGFILMLFINLAVCNLAMASNSMPQPQNASVAQALAYLKSVQNNDGGFPARAGGPSSRTVSEWTVMALKASGQDLNSSAWSRAGQGPLNYLKNSKPVLDTTTDYARTLMALCAANAGVQSGGADLVDKITSFQHEDGQFSRPGEEKLINAHMWSILALASAGQEIPNREKAKQWLLHRQNQDGGYGWMEGIESDVDDTAIAVQVLVLLGENPAQSMPITKALGYLKSFQLENGGFSSGWTGDSSNLNSDVWVMQGLTAAEQNWLDRKWLVNGNSVLTDVLGLQNSDGSFKWMTNTPSAPVLNTAYAVIALSGKTFPLKVTIQPDLPAQSFSDLNSTYWAYSPIMKLVGQGVLGGYPDGSFQPEKTVTRAEFTRFLVCGLGLDKSALTVNKSFSDLNEQHWAYKYISIAVSKGYVSGRTDGTFDPSGKITGAELATMMVKSLGLNNSMVSNNESEWYLPYFAKARESGILYPGFDVHQNVTRAQCADSIVRLQKVIKAEPQS